MFANQTTTAGMLVSDRSKDLEHDCHGASPNGAVNQAQSVYLSIVVPCHNEQENVAELYRRLSGVGHDLMKSYEIVLVNDGSTDGTWPLLRELAHADHHVAALNLSRNFGQQPALFAGLTQCRGERILILDADLQDPPELVLRMLSIMDDG